MLSSSIDSLKGLIAFVVIFGVLAWLWEEAKKPRQSRPQRRYRTVTPVHAKAKPVKSVPPPPLPPQPTEQELLAKAEAELESERARIQASPLSDIMKRRDLNRAEREYSNTAKQIRMRFKKI